MTGARFIRYELRTTGVGAARAFYAEVFGRRFWDAGVGVAPLPEAALARGAPPHWLGHVGVGDVDRISERFVAAGGQRLGPTERAVDGSSRAVIRDPFGAVLAVTSETAGPDRRPVAWHLHHGRDHRLTAGLYADLFGWTAGQVVDLGPERGMHQMFAWDGTGATVGSMANTADLPRVHPQWLFFFPVDDLEAAGARVRSLGGLVLDAARTAAGDLVAPCDDPQGGAFALYQFAR